MTTKLQTIADIRKMTVWDFFCPEETRSCTPVLAKRVYELCQASSIETVSQLADMSADQLRAKHFSEELIPYICLQLQRANPDLNLKARFTQPAGAQGRCPAVSVISTPELRLSGARLEV